MSSSRVVSSRALAAPASTSIADVIARMRALAPLFPARDGVASFHRLYTCVTENVAARLGRRFFAGDAYIERMDVVFANYYFAALAAADAEPEALVPKCWAPLFAARQDARIAPLVFAIAGMNAHVNHDLARTVYDVALERGLPPCRGSVEHDDFLRINEVLAATLDQAKPILEDAALARLDAALGRADDALALFSLAQAREAAWTGGETMWALAVAPAVGAAYQASLDRLVGMASRAMLAIGAGAGAIG